MSQTYTATSDANDKCHSLARESVTKVHRPIQYLGSKLRSLDDLLSATKHLFSSKDRVVDLFSGSSVVSQAFANAGARVTSIDVQIFCKDIAAAMLGEGRKLGESSHTDAATITTGFFQLEVPDELGTFLEKEALLLGSGPTNELLEFYRSLPQAWKSPLNRDWLVPHSKTLKYRGNAWAPIIASHYAGTYFGLRQAVFFDYVRGQIEALWEVGAIRDWSRFALLTALYSTMSRTVCSAGKHFAQPLATKETGNQLFQIRRLYSDRTVDPLATFVSCAEKIDCSAQPVDDEHTAIAQPADRAYEQIIDLKPALIYADPPYTAQQYSRFYHVLEIAATHTVPNLQNIAGRVTSGLYNISQYKSPFCSRVAAKPAFEALVSASLASGASLALSYSSSSKRSTGNARMIELQELIGICKQHYGSCNVDVIELAHAYRSFNSQQNNNDHRSDPEVLIICEA